MTRGNACCRGQDRAEQTTVWIGSDPEETRRHPGFNHCINTLVMNLEKLLELLFVFLTDLLPLLLGNEGGRSIRTVLLKAHIAAA